MVCLICCTIRGHSDTFAVMVPVWVCNAADAALATRSLPPNKRTDAPAMMRLPKSKFGYRFIF